MSNINWPKKWKLQTLEVSTSLGIVSNLALLGRIGFTLLKKLPIKKSVEDDFRSFVIGGLFFHDSEVHAARFTKLEDLGLFSPLIFEDVSPLEPLLPNLKRLKMLCELSEIDKRRSMGDQMTIPTQCMSKIEDLFVGITIGSRSYRAESNWGLDRHSDKSSNLRLKLIGFKSLKKLKVIGDVKKLVFTGRYPKLQTIGTTMEVLVLYCLTSMDRTLERVISGLKITVKEFKYRSSGKEPVKITNITSCKD